MVKNLVVALTILIVPFFAAAGADGSEDLSLLQHKATVAEADIDGSWKDQVAHDDENEGVVEFVGRQNETTYVDDLEILSDDTIEDANVISASGLPPCDATGVCPDQRPAILRHSDIRGYIPNIASIGKCQCQGKKYTGTAAVLYRADNKRCILLKPSINFGTRVADGRFSTSNKMGCFQTVPASCSGLQGSDFANCAKLRAAAAHTSGSWIAGKKCLVTIPGNPKMYDWDQAKDYCLNNWQCVGIAKLTVKMGGGYKNEYTLCKPHYGDELQTSSLPAAWNHGGVMEVKRSPQVDV